jgi:hypothetical protein
MRLMHRRNRSVFASFFGATLRKVSHCSRCHSTCAPGYVSENMTFLPSIKQPFSKWCASGFPGSVQMTYAYPGTRVPGFVIVNVTVSVSVTVSVTQCQCHSHMPRYGRTRVPGCVHPSLGFGIGKRTPRVPGHDEGTRVPGYPGTWYPGTCTGIPTRR